ncbi:MAG: RecB family exonuclease [Candidatus Woesearchaeota archaeon]
MGYYSYSKINTFKQCKYKYKLQYIDRVKVKIPTTIEAFMGNIVHKTLEKLYKEKLNNKILSLKETLEIYENLWNQNYTEEILIVKKENSAKYYNELGKKFIIDYYNKYKPFNEMNIIGIETQDKIKLNDGNYWHVRIDKLGHIDNRYYICDYKTNNYLKTKEEAENDEQLLMYSLFVKERFKDAKEIILKWHMLAFNEEVTTIVNFKKLDKLHNNIINLIKKINLTTKFDYQKSALCKYCVYQEICPSFKEEYFIDKNQKINKFNYNNDSNKAKNTNLKDFF